MVTSFNKSSAAFRAMVPVLVIVPPERPVPAVIEVRVPPVEGGRAPFFK